MLRRLSNLCGSRIDCSQYSCPGRFLCRQQHEHRPTDEERDQAVGIQWIKLMLPAADHCHPREAEHLQGVTRGHGSLRRRTSERAMSKDSRRLRTAFAQD
jgi:hypothetical protein